MKNAWALLFLMTTAACAPEADEVELPGTLDEAKFDSPDYVAYGTLVFDEEQPVDVLLGGPRFHSWTFQLHGPATLDASTGLLENDHLSNGPIDTAVGLYRHNGLFWSAVVSNDDHDGQIWGALDGLEAGAGLYLVLVHVKEPAKAYPFALRVHCEGEGCAASADQ